jgi:hypothetical protein
VKAHLSAITAVGLDVKYVSSLQPSRRLVAPGLRSANATQVHPCLESKKCFTICFTTLL